MNDDDCITGRLRRGMCERHYRRFMTHGETSNPRIDNLNHYDVDERGCWLWRGARWRNGYGKTSTPIHGTCLAHRAFYIEHRGPVPSGQDLDHLCRVRHCINPDHLEPVSRATNLERGHDARTFCENGLHDITLPGAVRPGTRQCIACWRRRYKAAGERYRARRKA